MKISMNEPLKELKMRTTKLKIVLVLTGTLLLGFFLGLLTSAQIRNAHIKKYRTFASRDGFAAWTIHVIDPTPEQKEKILPVVEKYAEKNLDLRRKYREEFIRLMKDYRNELYPLLTPEQINKLENMTRPHRPGRGPRRGKGPGPGGPPMPSGKKPCDLP